MTWKTGEKIGAYVLGEQLGQGGMATVYKGYHEQLDREVAIKVMHQNFLEDANFVARFRREAQIVAKLNHPHIVPVYDFNEHDHQPYLVMQYVPGQTLKQRYSETAPTLEDVMMVMTAVGDALAYAHRQGVLHRDIKPSNIVLDDEKIPYLTDFGLARIATAGESTMSADMLLGTPHYISPEQARGATNLDGRTDIYSLGVVLYELLVGQVPFTGDSAYSIIHDHINTPLPLPSAVNPEIPAAVELVLLQALEKDPRHRYATADAMMRELKDAIEEGQLTRLNPQRQSIAATSLARLRSEEAVDSDGIGAPTSSVSARLARETTLAQPAKWYQDWRVWAGTTLVLAVLVVSGFLFARRGVQNGVITVDRSALETPNAQDRPAIQPQREIPRIYRDLGVEIANTPYPSLTIPFVDRATLDEAIPADTSDPIASLLYARSQYPDEPDAARTLLIEGLPQTNDLVVYLTTAVDMAVENGDISGALTFAIVALEAAANQERALYDVVRPAMTETIYALAPDVRLPELEANLRQIADDVNINPRGTLSLIESEGISFARQRNLIENGNLRLAQAASVRSDSNTRMNAEFALIRGELLLALNEEEAAEAIWEDILEETLVPAWVENRAQTLLDSLD